jgi:hypothetical protein
MEMSVLSNVIHYIFMSQLSHNADVTVLVKKK